MITKVSVARAKAEIAAIMNQVAYSGEHVVIERRGKPMVALVTIEEFELIQRERPHSTRMQGALALTGAWNDLEDWEADSFIADIYASRDEDIGRRVDLED